MPAPPSANLPLTERLLVMAQTLQFAWFIGHLTLILCTLYYGLAYVRFNYYSSLAVIAYRTTFIAAAATYGIVVYKTLRARAKTGTRFPGGALGLLSDENVQYLIMALVWLFAPQYPLAMLPYAVYSVFHFATYTRSNLIPVLQPPKQLSTASPGGKPQFAPNPIADRIGAFVKQYYDASMSVVSALEILLWLRLLLAAIFFQRRSWILIGVYTLFLRARFAQSSHVQESFRQLEARVDSLVGGQGTPPAARQAWDAVKGAARSFHGVTDVGRYAAGAAPPSHTAGAGAPSAGASKKTS